VYSNQNNPGILVANRRSSVNSWVTTIQQFAVTVANRASEVITTNWPSGVAGGVVSPTTVNPVLEVELPWYTSDRFHYGKNLQNELQFSADQRGDSFSLGYLGNFGNITAAGILSYVAVGEDFNLGFFCACPVVYTVTSPQDPIGNGV
jgi:hypothetical protein